MSSQLDDDYFRGWQDAIKALKIAREKYPDLTAGEMADIMTEALKLCGFPLNQ